MPIHTTVDTFASTFYNKTQMSVSTSPNTTDPPVTSPMPITTPLPVTSPSECFALNNKCDCQSQTGNNCVFDNGKCVNLNKRKLVSN